MPNGTITIVGVENASTHDKKFKLKKNEPVQVVLSGDVSAGDGVNAQFTSGNYTWTTPPSATVAQDASGNLYATFYSTPSKKDGGDPVEDPGDLTVQVTDTTANSESPQTPFQVDYVA